MRPLMLSIPAAHQVRTLAACALLSALWAAPAHAQSFNEMASESSAQQC